jgi:hypothetical protein
MPSLNKRAFLRPIAAAAFCVLTTTAPVVAQGTSDSCKPATVIPLTGSEPPARIFIDSPLPGPLASRGVVIIQFCAQNLHIAPVFGPGALAVSPRVGHVHVSLDDAPGCGPTRVGIRSSCSIFLRARTKLSSN